MGMGGGRICMAMSAVGSVMLLGRMLLIGACLFDAVMLPLLPSGSLLWLLSLGLLVLLLLSSGHRHKSLSSPGSLLSLLPS
jgi:hypothetical protein